MLILHRAFVHNGHLRGPVTFTRREFGTGVVTSCFHDLGLSRLVFEQPTLSMLRYAMMVPILSLLYF